MGDLMADSLDAGFYGVYSHDEEEGVIRVFDPLLNPGVDMWTCGFNPEDPGNRTKDMPKSRGGTVKYFLDQTVLLLPVMSSAGVNGSIRFSRRKASVSLLNVSHCIISR